MNKVVSVRALQEKRVAVVFLTAGPGCSMSPRRADGVVIPRGACDVTMV